MYSATSIEQPLQATSMNIDEKQTKLVVIEKVEHVEGSSSATQSEMRAPDTKWTRNGAVTLSNAPLKERYVSSGSNQPR